jgi:haloalkane dehalogenase
MPFTTNISSTVPYESHFIEVYGSKMHYLDVGTGDPILFLHGNPTSSYLWRNVIPHLTSLGRCIAPDLIGMGKSDSPAIDYRFVDHARYLQRLIEVLGLKRITFVLHDWGSALGFHYACQHESNVKGLVFMEAIVMAARSWDGVPQEMRQFQQALRTPDTGWELAVHQNIFIERILPGEVLRGLSEDEMSHYRAPFLDPARRKPLWRWPNEVPIAGEPVDVVTLVTAYNQWLQQTELPKLLLTARPGRIMGDEMIEWCQSHLQHLTVVATGPALHFLQEDNPEQVGQAIARWYRSLKQISKP